MSFSPEVGKRYTQTDRHLTAPGADAGNAKNVVVPATDRSADAFLIEPFWEQTGWRRAGNRDECGDKVPGVL